MHGIAVGTGFCSSIDVYGYEKVGAGFVCRGGAVAKGNALVGGSGHYHLHLRISGLYLVRQALGNVKGEVLFI